MSQSYEGPQVQVHKPGKGTLTPCPECGEEKRAYLTTGVCKRCYDRRYHRTGPCVVCGRTRRIAAKSMCSGCYRLERKTRPESQDVGQPKRIDRPEDFAAAKSREADFVEFVLPVVEKYTTKWFGKLGDDALEDALAEARACGWVQFARWLTDGKDPVAGAADLAMDVRRYVWRFGGVNGNEPPKDVLSRRAQVQKNFLTDRVGDEASSFAADQVDPADDAGWNVDFESFYASLSPTAQALLDDRLDGWSWEELSSGYGLGRDVVRLLQTEMRAKFLDKFQDPVGVK